MTAIDQLSPRGPTSVTVAGLAIAPPMAAVRSALFAGNPVWFTMAAAMFALRYQSIWQLVR